MVSRRRKEPAIILPKYIGEFMSHLEIDEDLFKQRPIYTLHDITGELLYPTKIDGFPEEVIDWFKIPWNIEKFLLALRIGYRIEEDYYYIELLGDDVGAYLIYYPNSENYGVVTRRGLYQGSGITKFTEKEIKEMDKPYWALRVPLEELEK